MTFKYSIKKPLLVIVLLLLVTSISAYENTIVQSQVTSISAQHSNGACWFFPINHSYNQNPLYNIKSEYNDNRSYCHLDGTQTASMNEGQYILLYIYPLKTATGYLYDISFEDSKLVSVFAKTKPIDVAGIQSDSILTSLRGMLANSTDGYEEYIVTVEPPYLVVDTMGQLTETVVRISGKSNLVDKTPVTVVVDETEHYAKQDLMNFTFYGKVVHPDITVPGTWVIDMRMPLQYMAPGWHEAVATAGKIKVTTRFPIYQTWEPAPTPTQYINYFGNGTIKPDIVTVEKIITVVETKEVIVQLTATPTPDITDALGEKVEGNLEVPIVVLFCSSIGLAFMILLSVRYKR